MSLNTELRSILSAMKITKQLRVFSNKNVDNLYG